MNKHKKTILIVVGVLVLLIFLTAAVLLYLKYAEFEKTRQALNGMLAEQQRLFNRAPFPAIENITQENDNLDLIRLIFAELVGVVRFGQIEPVQQAPAAFNAQIWKVQKELLALAREKGVIVPPEFAFGFQRHMGGFPPQHPDVPRLTQQLLIISELTKLLYDSRIVALRDIYREEFEGSGAAAPVIKPLGVGQVMANPISKDAGLIAEGSLSGYMHFTLRFDARESTLPEILNRLARDRMFIVVTRLEISGGVTSLSKPTTVQPAAQPGESPSPQPGKVLPRDERLVCGTHETTVLVTIDVDVYRFRPVEEIVKQ